MVEAQSLGVGVEEGGPFQGEAVVEEGPYLALEEEGVDVQNQVGEEVAEVQNLVVEEEVGEAVVEEEVGEEVVDKVEAQARMGEVVGEKKERCPLVKVVIVEAGAYLQRLEGEGRAGGLDGRCPVASAGTCRQSSL